MKDEKLEQMLWVVSCDLAVDNSIDPKFNRDWFLQMVERIHEDLRVKYKCEQMFHKQTCLKQYISNKSLWQTAEESRKELKKASEDWNSICKEHGCHITVSVFPILTNEVGLEAFNELPSILARRNRAHRETALKKNQIETDSKRNLHDAQRKTCFLKSGDEE